MLSLSRAALTVCRWGKVNSVMITHLDADKDGKVTVEVLL